MLPRWMQAPLERRVLAYLTPPGMPAPDFRHPRGEPALLPPHSLSWQLFNHPLALAVGGVAAVVLELAEPRVRTGVWEHTRFRDEPLARLQRTGLAAMMTVYGPQGAARAMIDGVRRRHEAVRGTTPEGRPYCANDPELLDWVQVTAAYGFIEAFNTYVRPLPQAARDALYDEASVTGSLYGAPRPPVTEAQAHQRLHDMLPGLAPSPIVLEFLDIMARAPLLPPGLRALQPLLGRAAVALVPAAVRERLGLGDDAALGPRGQALLRSAGRAMERLEWRELPAAQACERLGLDPRETLHRRSWAAAIHAASLPR